MEKLLPSFADRWTLDWQFTGRSVRRTIVLPDGGFFLIDSAAFSPFSALLGGGAIGFSAGLLYLSQGRIAGISGLLGHLVRGEIGGGGFRLFFLLGLILSPLLWSLFIGDPFAGLAASGILPTEWWTLAIAGGLVGIGTRLANGCTSGHGICGLARFSMRSAVAVLSFMVAGVVTVFIVRHTFGA